MSILTLVKSGALEKARNALAAGGTLGTTIATLRRAFPNRGRRQNTYEDFRNVVRRAQRAIDAGNRLENGTAAIPVRALPVQPSDASARAGQREYETIVVIDRGDGSRPDRQRVTVLSRTDLSPNEIRTQAVSTLNDELRNDQTALRSGFNSVDLTGEAQVDVIIKSASVRAPIG